MDDSSSVDRRKRNRGEPFFPIVASNEGSSLLANSQANVSRYKNSGGLDSHHKSEEEQSSNYSLPHSAKFHPYEGNQFLNNSKELEFSLPFREKDLDSDNQPRSHRNNNHQNNNHNGEDSNHQGPQINYSRLDDPMHNNYFQEYEERKESDNRQQQKQQKDNKNDGNNPMKEPLYSSYYDPKRGVELDQAFQSETQNKVLFYRDKIFVEKSSADSAQSIVFFGRESSMQIRAVLKQYSGKSFESIFKEIKIFTLLEVSKRSNNNENSDQNQNKKLSQVIKESRAHDGLPDLLGYTIHQQRGEIMMSHGGDCLEDWLERLKVQTNRVGFALEMLRQILPALSRLHSLGYSHGDLKPENICARTSYCSNFKFTLIDFGMVQRLPEYGKQPKRNQFFKGNFLFASIAQLKQMKPTPLDDYISLMYVAWYFVRHGLLWTDYIDACLEENPDQNLYDVQSFKTIRLQRDFIFQRDFEKNTDMPFGPVFKYLHMIQERQRFEHCLEVDYQYILDLLPSELTFHKSQLVYSSSEELSLKGSSSRDLQLSSQRALKHQKENELLQESKNKSVQSGDQNLSGFWHRVGDNYEQVMEQMEIPKKANYDAQLCYDMAMEQNELPYINHKTPHKKFDSSKRILLEKSQTNQPIEYVSPLYLANLMLCRAEKISPEKHLHDMNSLNFKVLEQDNPLDELASDSGSGNNSQKHHQSVGSSNQANINNQQQIAPPQQHHSQKFMSSDRSCSSSVKRSKISEKASHLIGRSYRNAVVHSSFKLSQYNLILSSINKDNNDQGPQYSSRDASKLVKLSRGRNEDSFSLLSCNSHHQPPCNQERLQLGGLNNGNQMMSDGNSADTPKSQYSNLSDFQNESEYKHEQEEYKQKPKKSAFFNGGIQSGNNKCNNLGNNQNDFILNESCDESFQSQLENSKDSNKSDHKHNQSMIQDSNAHSYNNLFMHSNRKMEDQEEKKRDNKAFKYQVYPPQSDSSNNSIHDSPSSQSKSNQDALIEKRKKAHQQALIQEESKQCNSRGQNQQASEEQKEKSNVSSQELELRNDDEFDIDLNELDCSEYQYVTALSENKVRKQIMKHNSGDDKEKLGVSKSSCNYHSQSAHSSEQSIEFRMKNYLQVNTYSNKIKVKPKEQKISGRSFIKLNDKT